MPELRTVREDELAEMHAFDRSYAGSDAAPEEFRAQFASHPDLFVVCREDGDLVAEANGRMRRPAEDPTDAAADCVVLRSIAVKRDRRGEGLGRAVLERFEERAADRAGVVSAASANNVEGFYEACGYEPAMILLQVEEADLPDGYERADRLLGERTPEPGTRFLYAGFEAYDPDLRRDLADRFGAYEANTIYRKNL